MSLNTVRTSISIGYHYGHTRYACCACIKEKQIVVTTNFVTNHCKTLQQMNSGKYVTEGTKIVRVLKEGTYVRNKMRPKVSGQKYSLTP